MKIQSKKNIFAAQKIEGEIYNFFPINFDDNGNFKSFEIQNKIMTTLDDMKKEAKMIYQIDNINNPTKSILIFSNCSYKNQSEPEFEPDEEKNIHHSKTNLF